MPDTITEAELEEWLKRQSATLTRIEKLIDELRGNDDQEDAR